MQIAQPDPNVPLPEALATALEAAQNKLTLIEMEFLRFQSLRDAIKDEIGRLNKTASDVQEKASSLEKRRDELVHEVSRLSQLQESIAIENKSSLAQSKLRTEELEEKSRELEKRERELSTREQAINVREDLFAKEESRLQQEGTALLDMQNKITEFLKSL